jgi:ribose transport system ATP-binding protein
VRTKTAIHELIAEITRSGVAVLLISSDMPEMITLADRILVMRDFALVGEIENERRYDSMSRRIMSFIHEGVDSSGGGAQAEAGHG